MYLTCGSRQTPSTGDGRTGKQGAAQKCSDPKENLTFYVTLNGMRKLDGLTGSKSAKSLRWVAAMVGFALLVATASQASAAAGPVFTLPSASNPVSSMGITYPVSVSGTYIPIPMRCEGENRVLWYGPGTTPDGLWRNIQFPGSGSPTYTASALSINGSYQPVVGDFSGDGCEDVFWYAPGVARDWIWYGDVSGNFSVTTEVTIPLNANAIPIVGQFDTSPQDDIFWYVPGSAAESIWIGIPGAFVPLAAPAVNGTYTPVLAFDQSSILWFQSGPGADFVWRNIEAGATTQGTYSPTTVNGTYVARNLGGTPLLYAPGSNPDQAITGVTETSGPSDHSPVTLRGIAGEINGTYVVSNSTARAGFGVLHAPGPAADYLIIPRNTGTYSRQPNGSNGAEPNSYTTPREISADGNTVLMTSNASNLVADDTNFRFDVFLLDRRSNIYTRQPLGVSGAQPNGGSEAIAMSADGTKVLIYSEASNLTTGDTNGFTDMFIWDVPLNKYRRQPRGVDAAQADSNNGPVALSADGNLVLFSSEATNLVAGDTNGTSDVFIWDINLATYTRQPSFAGGAQPTGNNRGAAMTPDGSIVVFQSDSSSVVPEDTNGLTDMFVWIRETDKYERQPSGFGGQADGFSAATSVSQDGSKVAFYSEATNLVAGDTNSLSDAFMWDRGADTYTRQPAAFSGVQPNSYSYPGKISADGTKIAMNSNASNLVPGDTNSNDDTFIWDLTRGSYQQQPFGIRNSLPNGPSSPASMSATGDFVLVNSSATNLVASDFNAQEDLFVWNRRPS